MAGGGEGGGILDWGRGVVRRGAGQEGLRVRSGAGGDGKGWEWEGVGWAPASVEVGEGAAGAGCARPHTPGMGPPQIRQDQPPKK